MRLRTTHILKETTTKLQRKRGGVLRVSCLVLLLLVSFSVRAQGYRNTLGGSAEPFMALRTNILYDIAIVPNIGVEFALPMQFSIGADWFGTWLSSDKHHFYWQGYGGYLTARYYFGRDAAGCPLTGHHVGIYGSCLTYDIELGGKGYQAPKFGFGGGVEYGYSLPVGQNVRFDFNIGIGYQGGEYKTYRPTDDGTGHYEWIGTYRRHWWGPTKAEISLKVLIGAARKGGRR